MPLLKIHMPPFSTIKCKVVRWAASPAGHFNKTDGSSFGNRGPTRAEEVRRNCNVEVIFAFQESIGIRTNMYAELFVVHKGPQLCKERDISNILVEMDAKATLKLILNNEGHHWSFVHILGSTSSLIRALNVSVSHIYGEGKVLADFLAKGASTMEQGKVVLARELTEESNLFFGCTNFNILTLESND